MRMMKMTKMNEKMKLNQSALTSENQKVEMGKRENGEEKKEGLF